MLIVPPFKNPGLGNQKRVCLFPHFVKQQKKGGWELNFTFAELHFSFFCSLFDTSELLNYPSVCVRTNKRFNFCWKENPYFFLFFQNFLLCIYIHFFNWLNKPLAGFTTWGSFPRTWEPYFRKLHMDFPGGLVAKTPCSQCTGLGFKSWSGN